MEKEKAKQDAHQAEKQLPLRRGLKYDRARAEARRKFSKGRRIRRWILDHPWIRHSPIGELS